MWQGFVQKWLTYANDSKWNDVYQKSPDYFSAVLKEEWPIAMLPNGVSFRMRAYGHRRRAGWRIRSSKA